MDTRASRGGVMLDVLISDGDGRARRAAAARLEEDGHYVLEASDGAYAIDLLRERTFDVVVCDLTVPRVWAWRSSDTSGESRRERLSS